MDVLEEMPLSGLEADLQDLLKMLWHATERGFGSPVCGGS